MTDTNRLQKTLEYRFADPGLLELALTHRSAGGSNNERLEFLGDSILNHLIAETLFQRFPQSQEGELSRMRAALVKGDTLAEVAQELQLGSCLTLGSGEKKSGGHRRASILADALEAVLGALFLDGGYTECRNCVGRLFDGRLDKLLPGAVGKDAKTRLQEFLQHRGEPLPVYALIETAGAEHNRQFTVTCQLRQRAVEARGEGSSRRKAEQDAAARVLEKVLAHER